MQIEPIAFIKNRFTEKFGIPRQSGKVKNLSEIIFVEKFRSKDAIRGIEGFSHLWLIFDFSLSHKDEPALTVRPPRLGGNKRVGVFATRSPFRPNSLGLSAVRLIGVKDTKEGPALVVEGADLLNDTPIYDIKPYIPYCDSIPAALGGFTNSNTDYYLDVAVECEVSHLNAEIIEEIKQILREDPRPQYKEDSDNVYKMRYGGYEVAFTVKEKKARITAIDEKTFKARFAKNYRYS